MGAQIQIAGPAAQAAPSKTPDNLVGPSPIIPVQLKGIYTKTLMDTGAQVTLLYQHIYDKPLEHLFLHKLEELGIWALRTSHVMSIC